jgi:hypothetical protein
MSFDTILDFTPVVDGITLRMNNMQTQINADTTVVTQLQASQYSTLLDPEINIMLSNIAQYTTKVQNYQSILDEITRIQSMSVEDKASMYYYFTILGVSKMNYMTKMLFNTDALNNENVQALYADVITPTETKLIIAKIIYDRFYINSVYSEISEISMYLVS